MFSLWWYYFVYYCRPLIKWFLRRTTGLCELQRLCYGRVSGAARTASVELSLTRSRSSQIQQLIAHLNDISDNRRFIGVNQREVIRGAISTVLLVKKINPRIHFQFVKSFEVCVQQIWTYRQLCAEVEAMRQTLYDCDNAEHERKLYELWLQLQPDVQLEARVTKQWQDIGFQGDDPKTDFRGMGLLGLENLLFFATEYRGAAMHVLSHSRHPRYGYAFAIVGINLTSMAWHLLRDGDAKTYFYNNTGNSRQATTVRLFHQFYSYLFYEFDRYWIECKPKDIMEFSTIKDSFERNIRTSLADPKTVLRINISVDTV